MWSGKKKISSINYMDLQLQSFSNINLADPFFDSLKEAYPEFSVWYNKKAAAGEKAYVFHNEAGQVTDFLYMKIETEDVTDVVPVLPAKRRLKVGTFKLLSRGTRRGERFMKKIMDRWGISGERLIFHKNARIVKILNECGHQPQNQNN